MPDQAIPTQDVSKASGAKGDHPDVYCEVINLTRASARRTQMENELAKANVAAAFHPAYDYKEHSYDDMLEHCTANGPWGVFDPGNMACTISHKNVWERFLQTDASFCFVMEDDVFISPELGKWLNDTTWWPENAHLVKFERWHGRSTKVLLEPSVKTHLDRNIRRLKSRHIGAGGYMMTREGAENLLSNRPFRQPIDNYIFNFNASKAARSIQIYQVAPAMIVQGNTPPDTPPSIPLRARPAGIALWTQKLKRGYYEVAYPLRTIFDYMRGHLTLETVSFEPNAIRPLAQETTSDI